MDDLMISVEDVSMRFSSGIERGFSLKQGFVDLCDRKKREERRRHHSSGGELWALSHVSLDVKRGEVVGLVGANGAGKSTLLKIVAGVLKPTEGRVRVCGTVCPMIELGAGFDMELTARENIYLNGALMGYSEAFLNSKFDEIVAFSELESFLDVPVRSFSSGMTARLAFSVATVVEPEILIVDEILSVGDLAFQQKSEAKMLGMINGGTTVLYVSHSLEPVRKLCSRALWLDRGCTRAVGSAEEVCRQYVNSALRAES